MIFVENLRKKVGQSRHKQLLRPYSLPLNQVPASLTPTGHLPSPSELYLTVFPTFSQPPSPQTTSKHDKDAHLTIHFQHSERKPPACFAWNSSNDKKTKLVVIKQGFNKKQPRQVQKNKSLLTKTLERTSRVSSKHSVKSKMITMNARNQTQRQYNRQLISQHQNRTRRAPFAHRSSNNREKLTVHLHTQNKKFRLTTQKRRSASNFPAPQPHSTRKISISGWKTKDFEQGFA